MVGKDILRFHSIYWPILLMMLDIKLPERLIAHGWFVMKDGKMSKSKGNVIYPEMLVERFGLDPLRYYLMRSLPVGSDGTFTPEDYVARINYELANDLGNLLNRTVAMINKYFGGQVPAYVENVTDFDADLAKVVAENIEEFHKQMNAVDSHVPWTPFGTSFHVPISILMKQLHGFSPKKMVTRNNWQQLWLTWLLVFVSLPTSFNHS